MNSSGIKRHIGTVTNRRSLVKGGVSLAALALGGSKFARPVSAQERADVIVIGSGLSGLFAAVTLADQGANVTVLEASDRIGGRCFTARSIDGEPELGASQVGPYYARVRDAISRFGLSTEDGANVNAPFTLALAGELVPIEDWPSSKHNHTAGDERVVPPPALLPYYLNKYNPLTDLDDWLEKPARQYDVSVGHWLRKQGASPAALRLINEGLIASDIWSTSLLTMLQEATRGKLSNGEALFEDRNPLGRFEETARISQRIVGGTSRLPETMAAFLGDAVRRNKIATHISMTASGAEVTCMDGSRYVGDFIVSAVPFSRLKNIVIDPPLIGDQADAVEQMPYANTTLVFMNLKGEPYWEKDGFDASIWSDGPVNMVRQPIDPDGSRDRLVAVVTGDKADRLDQLSPVQRGAFTIAEIERLRPSTRGKLEVSGVHSWRQQTFIAGCRHAYPVGHAWQFAQAIINPHERLHFAGEHTRRLEIGMEAAAESGERAALEILERVSG